MSDSLESSNDSLKQKRIDVPVINQQCRFSEPVSDGS